MSKLFRSATEALKQLRADKEGVVSFEYVIVAACVVTVVIAVFNGNGAGTIRGALNTGLTAITTAIGTL